MVSKTTIVSAVFAMYVFAMFAIASIPEDLFVTAEAETISSISVQ